ncbi:EAL domain-containing protein [Klebsiella aerogenes]|uniref:EAL domain-containing protein n=1 Tax=Klebsiella aerogenes TaxID=548 RepID=UPI003877E937
MIQTLGRCQFPARRLQLEVTESYVLENPERARVAIENLKSLGIAVALDDFGIGYSSIGYLRSFRLPQAAGGGQETDSVPGFGSPAFRIPGRGTAPGIY